MRILTLSAAPALDIEVHSTQFAAAASRQETKLDRCDIEAQIGREYAGLQALIVRRAGDPQVAADLLNEAICTTWEKYMDGRISRPDQIAGYVFQVALNLLRNRRRSFGERPDRRVDPDVIQTLASDDPEGECVDDRVTDRVIRIIRSMESPRDRTVLVRFYLDEDDRESICRELQLTPAQFATVLHRARQRLRQLLEADGLKSCDLFSRMGS